MNFTDQEWPDTIYIVGLKELCRYRYYLFDGEIPMRTTVAEDNTNILSDVPNYRTRKVEKDNNYLAMMRDVNNHDYKEISKEDFYHRCDEYMAYWTEERIKAHDEHVKADNKNFEENREDLEKMAREVEERLGIRKS